MNSLSEAGHGWKVMLHEDMSYSQSTIKNQLHWCWASCLLADEDLYQAGPGQTLECVPEETLAVFRLALLKNIWWDQMFSSFLWYKHMKQHELIKPTQDNGPAISTHRLLRN